LKQREEWFDGQLDLDPERLVFIDETWTATNMTRSHGRCASVNGGQIPGQRGGVKAGQ
jgi:hypothetical protein